MTSTIDPAPEAPAAQRFTAILTVEGVQTGDRRFIAPGALDWRDLPLPLMFQKQTPAGGMGGNPHAGAVAGGRIETIERAVQPDGTVQILGTGTFDAGPDGQEAARMVGDGTIRGVSVDLTNVVAEPECLAEEDGECVDGRDVFTQGRIMGATITPFQAIEPATIALAASLTAPGADIWLTDEAGERFATPALPFSVTQPAPAGSAAPLVPPVEWFAAPQADRAYPLTITPEGRVHGYLAQWGQCHLGFVNQAFKKCVTVPSSKSGYALFAKPGGQLAQCCGDCEPQEMTVGTLVFGTTHADLSLPWKYAAEFYENTGKVAAHVAIGEDEIGVWFSGVLNPALSAEDIWTLRGAKVSGDWRKYGGALELTSILCVNTPGFPVGAPKVGFGDSGEMTALVASLAPEGEPAIVAGPSWTDFNQLRNELAEVRETNQRLSVVIETLGLDSDAAEALAASVWGDLYQIAETGRG